VEDDEEQDQDPHHQYVNPTDVIHSIFGGKVSIESKRESASSSEGHALTLMVPMILSPIQSFPPGLIERSLSAGKTDGPPSLSRGIFP